MIEAWGRCTDYEYYARTVLAEVDFRGFLIDLIPLRQLRLDELIISGLLTRVDLRSLSDDWPGKLTRD